MHMDPLYLVIFSGHFQDRKAEKAHRGGAERGTPCRVHDALLSSGCTGNYPGNSLDVIWISVINCKSFKHSTTSS